MSAISNIAATSATPAPVPAADMRPTADVAALSRNQTPQIPMPFPASLGQHAEVNQSRLSAVASTGEVAKIERVLKPYGVTMLPDGPVEDQTEEAKTDPTLEDDADPMAATAETDEVTPTDAPDLDDEPTLETQEGIQA